MNSISIYDLTITFISQKYPRKLLQPLTTEWNYAIKKIENGIYYLLGNLIPIQFIVTSKLSTKENLWLKSLTNQLRDFELTSALAEDYKKHKTNTLYQSVMDIIIRANKQQFSKEVGDVCEALRELTREWYADELQEERESSFNNGVQDGEHRVNALNRKLLELGRNEDIVKATTDSEYQQQLFKEFGL